MKTIKKNLVSVIALLIIAAGTSAQKNNNKNNSVYAEFLGNGFVYSVNYDRIFEIDNKFKIAPRIGLEYIPLSDEDLSILDLKRFHFLTEVNLLINIKNSHKHYLETGLGLSFFGIRDSFTVNDYGVITKENSKLAKVGLLRLGYRHQKASGGIMYRAGLLVKLHQDHFSKSVVGDDLFYRLWPGFSIGYSF